MPINASENIWFNGKLIPWNDAKLHVMSHVVNYGSCVFEGMRCYQTEKGPAVFRLRDHIQRLMDSAKIYRMDTHYTVDELINATLDLVVANKVSPCYIRPIILRGYGTVGVDPTGSPIDVYIANYEWGKFLGGGDEGIDVCVSSWNRLAPNTMPTMSKAGANYMNSQLIRMEALSNGYSEGIALDVTGYVSEGPGENIFLVHKERLYTPPLANSVLPGITRNTVLHIAQDLGIPIHEQAIPRELLYLAEEVFFSGTAAEITSIRSVDKIPVGNGNPGTVTRAIRSEFYAIANGKTDDRHAWLTPVPMKQPVAV
ncbi:MAG TPA: branched-chain amino acid transaminase [Candidatus Bathyarchaeia archaeon]|nr:branched-chain amino acid transaminase [Dongiaceae bacterium]HVP50434.1 branched-chain amino acid transaminase [Candidatus Bathyarchaeia archaeon]